MDNTPEEAYEPSWKTDLMPPEDPYASYVSSEPANFGYNRMNPEESTSPVPIVPEHQHEELDDDEVLTKIEDLQSKLMRLQEDIENYLTGDDDKFEAGI